MRLCLELVWDNNDVMLFWTTAWSWHLGLENNIIALSILGSLGQVVDHYALLQFFSRTKEIGSVKRLEGSR